MSVLVLLLALLGCDDPPFDPDTLVDELRVVAAVAAPPEVTPGDVIELEVHVMDPSDAPRDLLAWFCTPVGSACAELSTGDRPLHEFSVARRGAALVETARFQVPQELDALLQGLGASAPVVQWTLACRPGLCPVIDAVAAAPAVGTEEWRTAARLLGGPIGWLRDVPLEGTSLAVRVLTLSDRPEGERNRNPGLRRTDSTPLEVAPGGALTLDFDAGEGTVVPMASAGAFEVDDAPGGGPVTLRWLAPAATGRVDLVVVVEDGIGGSSIWRDVATVR